MLEMTEETFRAALADTLQAGKTLAQDRIIDALNKDAVLTTNLDARWLTYIVELIEGTK